MRCRRGFTVAALTVGLIGIAHAGAGTGVAGPLRGLTVQGEGGSMATFQVKRTQDLLTMDRACTRPVPGGPGAWGGVLVHKDGAPPDQFTGYVVVNGVAGQDCAGYVVGLGPSPFRLMPGRYTAALLGRGPQSHSLGTDRGREIGKIRSDPRRRLAQRTFFVGQRGTATWSHPFTVVGRTLAITADAVRSTAAHASLSQSCLSPVGEVCAAPPTASARPEGDRGFVDPRVGFHPPGALAAGTYTYQGRLAGVPDSEAAAFALLVDVPQ